MLLQFVLRPIAQNMLADYLAIVLKKEQISATPDALWQLASSAKGSVRDALSLTDQAIAFGNGQIQDETVTQMLGLIDQTDVAQLLRAIFEQNTQQVGQMLVQMREQVVDAKAVFDSLVEILHDVALLQILPGFNLPLNSQQQQARIYLATHMPADTVQLYYEILVQSREKIALTNTPLQALEMAILRLLAFRPLAVAERPQVVELPIADIVQSQPSQIPMPQLHATIETYEPIANPIEVIDEPFTKSVSEVNDFPINNNQAVEIIQEKFVPTLLPEVELTTALTPELETEVPVSNSTSTDLPTATPDTKANLESTHSAISSNEQQAVYAEDEKSFQPTVITEDRLQLPIINALPNAEAVMPTHEGVTNALSADSPLALLVPQSQPLMGKWTPEKWDYWVYQARENGWLADDELVLAKRGSMVGQIDGQCEFVTAEQVLANSPTFMDLQHQLSQHFPQLQLNLRLLPQPEPQLLPQLPEQQQARREALALAVATEKISQTPVIQALLCEQASLDYVRLAK